MDIFEDVGCELGLYCVGSLNHHYSDWARDSNLQVEIKTDLASTRRKEVKLVINCDE